MAVRFKQHGLYHDLTWHDFGEQVTACAAALIDAGVQPGDRVGLLAENRVEWLVADMGILAAGAVNVPAARAAAPPAQVQFQLADAGARWLFVSTPAQLDKVRQVRAELPDLGGVVVFDGAPADAAAATWRGFLQRGRLGPRGGAGELDARDATLTPDDLATIMYTSGTTGNPKGVMLTHGNLLSNAEAFHEACPFPPEAVFLNWLPFSHIYARTVDIYLSLLAAMPLCLAESAETVIPEPRRVQPTHMSGVPRFYEKVLAAVRRRPGRDRAPAARALRRPHRLARLRRRPAAARRRPGVPRRRRLAHRRATA